MVSNLLRLLELPEAVRGMLEKRDIDMGHARALLGLESGARQIELAHRIVKERWSVRETEKAIRRLAGAREKDSGKPNGGDKDPNVRRLESELSEKLGAAVQIDHGRGGGRIVIKYHSLDELDGIVEHIH
jgi:ParB family transcriptional regulator, chromosome partitioning protein